jgi:hypothetical protein
MDSPGFRLKMSHFFMDELSVHPDERLVLMDEGLVHMDE